MAETSGTCQFTYDAPTLQADVERGIVERPVMLDHGELYPDGDWPRDDRGRWTCPHDAVEDGLCLFHLPPDRRDEDEVLEAFVRTVEEAAARGDGAGDRHRQFLGARLASLELADRVSGLPVEGVLDLSFAEIRGPVDLSGLRVAGTVRLVGADCAGPVEFEDAAVYGDLNCHDAAFRAGASFARTTVQRHVDFEDATFATETADPELQMTYEFGEDGTPGQPDREYVQPDVADFRNARVGGASHFGDAAFEGPATFGEVQFVGSATFTGTSFGEASFVQATFGGAANFGTATFGGEANFGAATFHRDAFLQAAYDDGATFRAAEFHGTGDFEGADLTRATFREADLSGATFEDADCRLADFESALLNQATLFGADFRGAKLAGAVLGDARVDERTRFLGRHDDPREDSPHTLGSILSRPRCIYDADYGSRGGETDLDSAKSVYRALEELGRTAARPRLQTRCFVRRQDIQKNTYRTDAAEVDTLQEKVVALARYSRAELARAVLLYGESPWRAIGYSVVTVSVFSLLYPLGGWVRPTGGDPITYGRIAADPATFTESVYYSVLTFTALGFGDYQPVGFGRVLTTVETGLGAVLVALLVFIFGRRAAK